MVLVSYTLLNGLHRFCWYRLLL